MKITDFMEGDLITRIKRTKPSNSGLSHMFGMSENIGDGSYIGDKLELIGHDEDTIMVIRPDDVDGSEIDLAKFMFDDDGWGYWPHPLWKKAAERIAQLVK
jgi:hypothetical protein